MNRDINDPWQISQDHPPSTFDGAIQFMHDWFTQRMGKEEDEPERPLIEVLRTMMERNPEEWWLGHHFGWGMGMRNLLRESGFGEKELNVSNLDDYYIAIIEQAVLGKGNNTHRFPDEKPRS